MGNVTCSSYRNKALPFHPNGMKFHAFDGTGKVIFERTYYSIGGGFVVNETAAGEDRIVEDQHPAAVPVHHGGTAACPCAKNRAYRSARSCCTTSWHGAAKPEIRGGLLHIWSVMQDCVERGCRTEGVLPGGLKVKRRAAHAVSPADATSRNRTRCRSAPWTG